MTSQPDKPHVLMVSKPVVPPFTDSGKNLVRDVVASVSGVVPHVMITKGSAPPVPSAVPEPIYGAGGGYAPGLKQNVRVLMRLMRPFGHVRAYHFFFAPNPKTSMVGKLVMGLRRWSRSVQTVSSTPKDMDTVKKLLFADRIVALSDHTARELRARGVEGVVRIDPAVPAREPVTDEAKAAVRASLGIGDEPFVLYMGDLEFSSAADVVVEAAETLVREHGVKVVMATRDKTPASRARREELQARIAGAGLAERVPFVGQVDDPIALVAAAEVHLLPAESLYAKMDVPLVLLESLQQGVPIVVADVPPLDELVTSPVGLSVPPKDPGALAQAVGRLLGDDEERRQRGDEGRRLVATKYDLATLGAKHDELYQDLLRR